MPDASRHPHCDRPQHFSLRLRSIACVQPSGHRMIGKIRRVQLREVWRHEAHDFTSWLQSNLDVLNEVLDLDLE